MRLFLYLYASLSVRPSLTRGITVAVFMYCAISFMTNSRYRCINNYTIFETQLFGERVWLRTLLKLMIMLNT